MLLSAPNNKMTSSDTNVLSHRQESPRLSSLRLGITLSPLSNDLLFR